MYIKKAFICFACSDFVTICISVAISAGRFTGGFNSDDFIPKGELTIDNVIYECYISKKYTRAEIVGYVTDEHGNSLVPESVMIPETLVYENTEVPVTEIAAEALKDCCSLKEIALPDSIDAIGWNAFKDATNLEKVVIPSTVEFRSFDYEVFEGTKVMDYFIDNAEDGAIIFGKNIFYRYVGDAESYVLPEDIDEMMEGCFENAGFKEFKFNEKIASIPDYAFKNCKNLKEITIPDNVKRIEDGAFYGCSSLEKIDLGDKLSFMCYGVFEGTKIKEIYIGEECGMSTGALAGCDTLENITISENNRYYVFEDDILYAVVSENIKVMEYFLVTSDKKSFDVPDDVYEIAGYAFYNCKNLEEITINFEECDSSCETPTDCNAKSSKLFAVGEGAFKGCENLRRADITSVYYIEDNAFENCVNLKDVKFSCTGYEIGTRAFANTGFENLVVEGLFVNVYDEAFADCKNLRSVEFVDNVVEIHSNVVANCPSLERVYISRKVSVIDEDAFIGCQNVKFELVKKSPSADIMVGYAEDPENDVTTYEFVGRVTVFDNISDFVMYASERIYVFLFGCQGIFAKLEKLFKFGYIPK